MAKCQEGTREKLIEEVLQGMKKTGDRQICWLNGPAGSGKSAVSQTIAERLAAKNRLAASFFFFRGAGDRSTIARFIQTLAHQLSISVPATKRLIQRVLRDEPTIATRALGYQFKRLVVEPMRAVTDPKDDLAMLKGPMALVIDALDECDDKDLMAAFIEIIVNASRETPGLPFRVFFTSRVEEHIREKLETPAARLAVCPLALEDFDAMDDIRTFFKARFETIYEVNRTRRMRGVPKPWPSDSDLEALVQKASGSFIFAFTLVNFIDDRDGFPQEKLPVALEAHAGLDPLYTQVLSAAPRNDHFAPVISTIMLLKQPLPINALGDLLQLESHKIVQALLGVQSILMIPGDDNQAVQLFHTSLRDFLIKEERSKAFFIHSPTWHLFIGAQCLKAILLPQKEGLFLVGQASIYATRNWSHHIHGALTWGGDQSLSSSLNASLASHISSFASQHTTFRLWINTILLVYYGKREEILQELHAVLSRLKVS